MKGENGVPETPDWVPPKPKPEPESKPDPIALPAGVVLGEN